MCVAGVSASVPSLEVRVSQSQAHQPRYFLLPVGLSQSSLSSRLGGWGLEEGVEGVAWTVWCWG